jgi:hypothetical protein
MGLPRYLSTVRVSYRELILEKFIAAVVILKTWPILFKNGK